MPNVHFLLHENYSFTFLNFFHKMYRTSAGGPRALSKEAVLLERGTSRSPYVRVPLFLAPGVNPEWPQKFKFVDSVSLFPLSLLILLCFSFFCFLNSQWNHSQWWQPRVSIWFCDLTVDDLCQMDGGNSVLWTVRDDIWFTNHLLFASLWNKIN